MDSGALVAPPRMRALCDQACRVSASEARPLTSQCVKLEPPTLRPPLKEAHMDNASTMFPCRLICKSCSGHEWLMCIKLENTVIIYNIGIFTGGVAYQ